MVCARYNGEHMNGVLGEIRPVADIRASNSKPLGLILFTKIENVVSEAIKSAIPSTMEVDAQGLQNYQGFYCTFRPLSYLSMGLPPDTLVLLRHIDELQSYLIEGLSTALKLGRVQPINAEPSVLVPFVCVATAESADKLVATARFVCRGLSAAAKAMVTLRCVAGAPSACVGPSPLRHGEPSLNACSFVSHRIRARGGRDPQITQETRLPALGVRADARSLACSPLAIPPAHDFPNGSGCQVAVGALVQPGTKGFRPGSTKFRGRFAALGS